MKVNKDLTAQSSANLIIDELKSNVGALEFNLEHDFFFGSSDFEIWTSQGQVGILLAESTDYSLTGISSELSNEAGRTVYTRVAVLNLAYQSGDLYITYQACADLVDAEDRYGVERNPGQSWNLSETGNFDAIATGDITFKDQYLASPISLSETGTTGILGLTATSLVGALNELADEVVPAGGTIGQTILKNSSTDYDISWGNNNIEAFPIGGLSPFLSTLIPTGWLKADGSTVNIADYPELFAIFGITYGGNGTTTFGLPDMSGIGVTGSGTQTGPSGQTYGDASAVGTIREDRMQVITGQTRNSVQHQGVPAADNSGAFGFTASGTGNSSGASTTGRYTFNSANSPSARTGTHTRGPGRIITWCVKARNILIDSYEDGNLDQRITNIENSKIVPSDENLSIYYAMDDIPEVPNDREGTVYYQDAFTSLDFWSQITGSALTVSNGILTCPGDSRGVLRTIDAGAYATVRLRYRTKRVGIIYVDVTVANFNNSTPIISDGDWHVADVTTNWAGGSGNYNINFVDDPNPLDGNPVEIDWIYVGSAKYAYGSLHNGSGTASISTIYGATAMPGIIGKALAFDGINDRAEILSGLPAANCSISLWFLANKNHPTANYIFVQDGGNARRINIATSNIIDCNSRRADGTTWAGVQIQAAAWTSGVWNHIVFIQEGLNLRVYLNGVMQDSETQADIYTTFLPSGRLGSRTTTLEFGKFKIDEVRVYNQVLSDDEIRNLYYTRASGPNCYTPLSGWIGTTHYERRQDGTFEQWGIHDWTLPVIAVNGFNSTACALTFPFAYSVAPHITYSHYGPYMEYIGSKVDQLISTLTGFSVYLSNWGNIPTVSSAVKLYWRAIGVRL